MPRAASSSATQRSVKWRPVPGWPHRSISPRALSGPGAPITNGRRNALTTSATNSSCPMTRARTRAARPSNPARARSGAAAAAGGCACALSKSPSLRRLLVSSLLMRRTLSAVAPAAFCTASSALAAAVWRFCPAASASSCACICSRLLRASSLSPAALRLPPTSPCTQASYCCSMLIAVSPVCHRNAVEVLGAAPGAPAARTGAGARTAHAGARARAARVVAGIAFARAAPAELPAPGLKAYTYIYWAVAGRRRQPAYVYLFRPFV